MTEKSAQTPPPPAPEREELEHGDVWEALAHAVVRLDSTDKMSGVLKAVNRARAELQRRHRVDLDAAKAEIVALKREREELDRYMTEYGL